MFESFSGSDSVTKIQLFPLRHAEPNCVPGCRSVLLYPIGASNVCCAVCNTVTPVSSPGSDTAQIVCGGCRTLLMYARGAGNVRCSCCNTINPAGSANQVAHINCGRCHTTLMYPYGAPSVKCALCQYVTNTGMANTRVSVPMQRPNGDTPASISSTTPLSRGASQTVIIENPTSVDARGKPVNNVVVGISSEK